jgi:hypothetical protein
MSMCAPGSACGCGSTASDLGGGVVMLVVGAVALGGVVAFLAAHLVLLALAAVALPVATLATVRYLRRYMVLVHKQPPPRVRQAAVATPALARPRPALAGSRAALAGSRPALARSRAVFEPRAALAQPRPALAVPAAAQLTMGGYHLHFHGVSAAEVAALLRHDGEPAALRREDLALPAAEERAGA